MRLRTFIFGLLALLMPMGKLLAQGYPYPPPNYYNPYPAPNPYAMPRPAYPGNYPPGGYFRPVSPGAPMYPNSGWSAPSPAPYSYQAAPQSTVKVTPIPEMALHEKIPPVAVVEPKTVIIEESLHATSLTVGPKSCFKNEPPPDWSCLYFMVGVVIAQPRWQNNPAFVIQDVTSGIPINSQVDFTQNLTYAPRAEFGFVTTNGLGMRLRGMYLRQDAQESLFRDSATQQIITAMPLGLFDGPGVGETGTASSVLQFVTIDLEATQDIHWASFSLRGSAGARYAYLRQEYSYVEINVPPQPVGTTENLDSQMTFSGVGPTVCLEGHRPLGASGLALFLSGRGSLLYGNYRQNVVNSNEGVVAATASKNELDFLPIGEFEAGLKWAKKVGAFHLFVSSSVFAQVWFGAGNSTDSSPSLVASGSTPFNFPDPRIQSGANSRQNLSILGLSLMAGVKY